MKDQTPLVTKTNRNMKKHEKCEKWDGSIFKEIARTSR